MKVRVIVVAMFVAVSAFAQQDWTYLSMKSADALRAGDYAQALKVDDRLINDMFSRLGGGENETKAFAVALAHKAMALAGLGRTDDALWYWHEAVSMFPPLANSDVKPFGVAGEFLKTHPVEELQGTKLTGDKSIQAPVVVKRVEPVYPNAAKVFADKGITVIEALIDETGTLRDARLVKANPSPTLSHSAFEAVRQWHFKPAMRDGQPIAVIYHLTINFKLR